MDDERNALISRIGTFFLLVGVLLMVIFVASDMGEQIYFRYFFLGVVCLFISLYFKRITAKKAPPSNRFEGVRKLQQKRAEAQKKREEAKKAKLAKK